MMLVLCLSLVTAGLLTQAGAVAGSLDAYWNVPLDKCISMGVNFDLDQFNIVHNSGNLFKGDKVNILYQPGLFPHYAPSGAPVNGGIPQRGDLRSHVAAFRHQLHSLPLNYTGLLVLDFEEYLPSYAVSLPSVYRAQSMAWVQQKHPNWTHDAVVSEAQRTFNASAKLFFEALVQEAVRQHPGSLVGFYHYPYCEDYKPPFLTCAPQLQELNDDLRKWLLNSTQALYPSVYLQQRFSAARQWRVVHAKLLETQRIRKKNVPVLPYMRYRYPGSEELVPQAELLRLLYMIRVHDSDGVVVWGAAYNLANLKSCLEFKDYLHGTLGPVLKCFHNMGDDDVQKIQERFSTIRRRWSLPDENDLLDKYHYMGVRNQKENVFTYFVNYNQNVRANSFFENYRRNRWSFNKLNDLRHGSGSSGHGSGLDFIPFKKDAKSSVSTLDAKISFYPNSSELFILSALLKNYCAL